MVGEVRNDFLLVPRVIATGHDVDAVLEEIVRQVRRHAESRGGVFDIRNDEIDLVMRDERRNGAAYKLAAGTTHHVSDEQQRGHARSTGILKMDPRRSSMRGRMTRNSPPDAVARARVASIAPANRTARANRP